MALEETSPDGAVPRQKTSVVRTGRARGRSKLHVSVVEAFEAQILSGELAVGERLPAEAEIARMFGVSTRSVREAIQILETKGLIRRKHGERALVVRRDVGAFMGSLATTVRQLLSHKSDYFVQLMDVRRIIEIEVVERLSSEARALSPEVEEALAAMKQAVEEGDFIRFADSDAAFHLGLVHSVGNEILNLFYNNLFALIAEVIRVSSRVPDKSLADGYAEHEEIYDLIKAGESTGARAAMQRQLEGSAGYLKRVIDNKRLSSLHDS